jgi:prolipoprotein diacylglyceryltransferase
MITVTIDPYLLSVGRFDVRWYNLIVLAAAIPLTGVNRLLRVTGGSLLKSGAVSALIAGALALLPVVHSARRDPAQAFRGGMAR